MSARRPFYRRVDLWLCIVGGFLIGWSIGEFSDHGPSASAWLPLIAGVALYAASFVVVSRRYSR